MWYVFYTPLYVYLDLWICSVKNISFLYVIWIFGSFFQDPKIRSVWPSSVVRWSGRRPSIAVDIPRGRRERVPRGRSYFSCFARRTIFYMVRGSWFEPRAVQRNLFSGPGFDSWAHLHVFRPVGSVAYVRLLHQ